MYLQNKGLDQTYLGLGILQQLTCVCVASSGFVKCIDLGL